MVYERTGLLLAERDQPQEDADLFKDLDQARLDRREVYKDLALDPERAKQATDLWHHGGNPNLSATHLDEVVLATRIRALKDYKRELIAAVDLDPATQQAYRWRVNEELANCYILRASYEGDTKNFRRWNEFIYGKPDGDLYRAGLDFFAHDAENILKDTNSPQLAKDAAVRVLEQVGSKRGYRELLAPTDETFERVRADHYREKGYYALLLAGLDVPEEGKITPDVGDPMLRHIIHNNLQSDYQLADAAGAAWGVTHSRREVERPAVYNMPVKRFFGLGPGHEIGSHLLEHVNGLRGPLALVSDGLDRVELGNEGRAIIREQVPYETFQEFSKTVRWRDIIRRHVAISYGHGTTISEDLPHTSDETYAFMNMIDTMYQSRLTPDDPLETEAKAYAKTDTLSLRVLKGTDGLGGAYLKDKVYLEGGVACWLEAALRGPEAIAEGDLGKFDITNPRHIKLLQDKGLLPRAEEAI
jgi:hypothetical protein